MRTNVEYLIPIQGLSIGIHEFDFKIDQKFFAQFEKSLVDGIFDAHLIVEKQSTLLNLEVSFTGLEKTACDRCLANISIPTDGIGRLVVKYAEDERMEGDIIFIRPGSASFDVAPFFYEAIVLATPIVKKYDCENDNPRPCDNKVLALIDQSSSELEEPKEEDIWSALKKFKPE